MVKIYVEGGGINKKSTTIACQEGFRKFLEKAGLKGRMPTVVPSGSRSEAYKDFCTAMKGKEHEDALLLVDSEEPVQAACQSGDNPERWNPWRHLKQHDGWDCPEGAENADCHLMVQCMESWFHADRASLHEVLWARVPRQRPATGRNPLGIFGERPCNRRPSQGNQSL